MSIYFGGGSYYIDIEQSQKLYQIIDSLPELLEKYQIIITSHTDNIGGKAYNEWLSKKRSEAVIQKLMQKSIPRDKIFQKDWGQENPLYDNSSYSGQIKNRRVDILFTPLSL